ncbi:MAG: hypothetical protein K1X29_03730 [Bdellovibrionales bacterium]|nr:hypothetical protein [Bdellovibrionales bacterium]
MYYNNLPPLTSIGPLRALDFPCSQKNEGGVIIFFHGYGANAYDLSSLQSEINLGPKNGRWIFPQGPKQVDIGAGFMGQAWFPIDISALERALAKGEDGKYSHHRPSGLNEARDQGLSFLKHLGVAPQELILGGFSQGSMLAMELTLSLPVTPKGLVLLSGTPVDEIHLLNKIEHHPSLKIFQSHGDQDQILPFSAANRMAQQLQAKGLNLEWHPFSGGHEIPRNTLLALQNFLRKLL